MPAIHIEFTEYYYPDGKDFPSKSFFVSIVWGKNWGVGGVHDSFDMMKIIDIICS